MDWIEYQRAALHRLRQRLTANAKLFDAVDAWAAQYGYPPGDPVRWHVASLNRHTLDIIAHVDDVLHRLAPYRPGVDPWKTRGLAAHLRPDFAIRGITER